ncbi:MAG: fumarylacetoacetate hydrolase family protein [Gammaproteobacteria bacterium]|jgi:2-keto-4-pentenoate hydratase/2-oxohepta-3-ene-1,7-dioic acid hydratase in catechol pathway
MKIARFQHAGAVHLGFVDTDSGMVTPLKDGPRSPDPMIALIEDDDAGCAPAFGGREIPLADVRLLHPIARPSKNVICVGKNYREHAEEFSRSGFDSSAGRDQQAVPDAPIVFSKAPCALAGARDDILVPAGLSESVDYEGELGVVIGRRGRAVKAAHAYDHVFGYAVINDATVRDLQVRHKQWLLGKSLDTFCPMGPWIVTGDELDPENLELSCWVNGELRQHANTRDLIFDIPTIIATVSTSMTLEPGDIIATGTPAGVGIGFDPAKFLHHGDVVKVAITGIGEIENTIVVSQG